MKTVVITGSTRGIGYGLAEAFLGLGCAVTVSGRTAEGVDQAVTELSARHDGDRILGQSCDVADFAQVQALWDAARSRFGKVDIWVNNAGISHPVVDFWEHTPGQIETVVRTNIVGAMYGARIALRGMLEQGFGAFYNMEGLGSDGRIVRGLAIYGSSKSALHYLTRSLVGQTKGTPVLVGAIRPGMVLTNLVTDQYTDRPEDWERAKRFLNIITSQVEEVTPWLARQVLANDKHGAQISYMTTGRLLRRFLALPFSRPSSKQFR